VRIGRVVLIGGLTNVLLLAASVVIQFATDWTGIGPWLAAPLTGMMAALIEVAREALTRESEPSAEVASNRRGIPVDRRTGPIRPAQSRPSVAAGVLVAVILVGLGGAAVTHGVATVSGYVTGNQVGSDRLLGGPVPVDSSGVGTTAK